MKHALTLFGEGEASWSQLMALMTRLGRRVRPMPVWPTAQRATPPGDDRMHVRRLVERTAMERTGMPLSDHVLEELAAAFPGLYSAADDDDGRAIR